MGLLGSLLDASMISKFSQADSMLGSELSGLLSQLPQASQNQIATTVQKLFQADDVSTALPGLNNLVSQCMQAHLPLRQPLWRALST